MPLLPEDGQGVLVVAVVAEAAVQPRRAIVTVEPHARQERPPVVAGHVQFEPARERERHVRAVHLADPRRILSRGVDDREGRGVRPADFRRDEAVLRVPVRAEIHDFDAQAIAAIRDSIEQPHAVLVHALRVGLLPLSELSGGVAVAVTRVQKRHRGRVQIRNDHELEELVVRQRRFVAPLALRAFELRDRLHEALLPEPLDHPRPRLDLHEDVRKRGEAVVDQLEIRKREPRRDEPIHEIVVAHQPLGRGKRDPRASETSDELRHLRAGHFRCETTGHNDLPSFLCRRLARVPNTTSGLPNLPLVENGGLNPLPLSSRAQARDLTHSMVQRFLHSPLGSIEMTKLKGSKTPSSTQIFIL